MIFRSRPKEAPYPTTTSWASQEPRDTNHLRLRDQNQGASFPVPCPGTHKATREMRRGRIDGDARPGPWGKQRQKARESGDYLSFKLPYRLNLPQPCTAFEIRRAHKTYTHTHTSTQTHTHSMVTKWPGVTLL